MTHVFPQLSRENSVTVFWTIALTYSTKTQLQSVLFDNERRGQSTNRSKQLSASSLMDFWFNSPLLQQRAVKAGVENKSNSWVVRNGPIGQTFARGRIRDGIKTVFTPESPSR
jgi:hypothetical protein